MHLVLLDGRPRRGGEHSLQVRAETVSVSSRLQLPDWLGFQRTQAAVPVSCNIASL